MTRQALTLAALWLLPSIAAAAEPASAADSAPLDEEFLEYFAEFENQADNWTLFSEPEQRTREDLQAEQ